MDFWSVCPCLQSLGAYGQPVTITRKIPIQQVPAEPIDELTPFVPPSECPNPTYIAKLHNDELDTTLIIYLSAKDGLFFMQRDDAYLLLHNTIPCCRCLVFWTVNGVALRLVLSYVAEVSRSCIKTSHTCGLT